MRAITLAAITLLAVGCARNSEPRGEPSPSASLTPIPGFEGYALAEPISNGGVTIVPVTRKQSETPRSADYITLEEAKKHGWVEITELPGKETVELLIVANTGPKPLLLVAGDLLLGGKQDRVVAKDTVVPAGEKMEVVVFCVEQGRWHGESMSFSPAAAAVPQGVRSAATYGRQEDVWENVREYNESMDAPRETSSVRAGLETEAAQRGMDAGTQKLIDRLKHVKGAVGFLYLRGGEIVTLELFGSEALFRASSPALLRGFFADAASMGEQTGSASLSTCADFVARALRGERSQTADLRANTRWDVEAAGVIGAESKASSPSGDSLIHGTYAPR